MNRNLYYLALIATSLMMACGGTKQEPPKVTIVESVWDVEMPVKTHLSEFGFFEQPLAKLQPVSGVEPYELNSSLFTDYAFKKRFIYLPEGATINYHPDEVLDFPQGTVIIKNFYYPADFSQPDKDWTIIETRLLIREPRGWTAYPYVWNAEQTDAKIHVAGKTQLVSWLDTEGRNQSVKYSVPSMPQCMSCHELSGKTLPIGPTARSLNRNGANGENQLLHLQALGWLHGLPALEQVPALANYEDPTVALDVRARAYLEINCGHCHRPEGPGKNSALHLMAHVNNPAAFGVGKTPIAAGRGSGGLKYDIVPGKPEESIMLYRMQSVEPGVMMPELGRKMVHTEGVELIREWIRTL
jgi:uncharacterized repeat protein (TIGR03806 family)